MNKQAFIIMYHTDYYILKRLLQQIDNEKFDIYLHVDKKVKNFDFEKTKKLIKKSNIFIVERLTVNWGTYSQVACELHLLKQVINKNYTYIHLLSGNDLLLKDSNTIYNFFEKNKGKEFIAYHQFDDISEEELSRIRYYHIFNNNRRNPNKLIRGISNKIYYITLTIEKLIKINRLKNNPLVIRKGANWFSITGELAKYIVSRESEIKKYFSHSSCADELFLQTITYNSPFKKNIYRKYKDEHQNACRLIDWNRGEPYTFTINDYQELMESTCFFARKFSSLKDKKIIDKIFQNYNK